MFFPHIGAGIIESDSLPRARIKRLHTITFGDVTMNTGQAKVVYCSLPAKSPRNDMVKMKSLSDEDLGAWQYSHRPAARAFTRAANRAGTRTVTLGDVPVLTQRASQTIHVMRVESEIVLVSHAR